MLNDLYDTLCNAIPHDESALFGLPVKDGQPIWLSVDHNAYPALLLPAQTGDARPDIVLRSVEVIFSRTCAIQTIGDQSQSGCYTIIRLKESDPEIVRLFMMILEQRFCLNAPPKNNAEIAANIQEIAALFSKVSNDPRDLIGLWGELYVISRSGNLEAATRSWSTRKTAKYDFVTDSFVLDVKATLSSTPKHRFSLTQLRPHRAYDAYIVSLCLVEAQAGQTVGALMDALSIRIDDLELRSAFLKQCLVKGGRDIYRSDLTLRPYPDSETPLVLYRADDIPAPEVSGNDPIDNVRFDVDLSEISALDRPNSILDF